MELSFGLDLNLRPQPQNPRANQVSHGGRFICENTLKSTNAVERMRAHDQDLDYTKFSKSTKQKLDKNHF